MVKINELTSGNTEILNLIQRPELSVTISKIHAWKLTEYTKCVFLDADCLVIKPIDELFEKEELSAVCDLGWPDCFNRLVERVWTICLEHWRTEWCHTILCVQRWIQFSVHKHPFVGYLIFIYLNLYTQSLIHCFSPTCLYIALVVSFELANGLAMILIRHFLSSLSEQVFSYSNQVSTRSMAYWIWLKQRIRLMEVCSPAVIIVRIELNLILFYSSLWSGDQGLLNVYFSDWLDSDISKRLSFIYNMHSSTAYTYVPAFKKFGERVKIVHFLGAIKPWMYSYDKTSGEITSRFLAQHNLSHVTAWWNIFTQIKDKLPNDLVRTLLLKWCMMIPPI